MAWLTLDAALNDLASNFQTPLTIVEAQAGLKDLLGLAGQVQAFTTGSTDALIYAGNTVLPGADASNVAAWQIANTYSNSNPSCMIIDKTDAAEFINSDSFKSAAGAYLQKIDGIDPADGAAIKQAVNDYCTEKQDPLSLPTMPLISHRILK